MSTIGFPFMQWLSVFYFPLASGASHPVNWSVSVPQPSGIIEQQIFVYTRATKHIKHAGLVLKRGPIAPTLFIVSWWYHKAHSTCKWSLWVFIHRDMFESSIDVFFLNSALDKKTCSGYFFSIRSSTEKQLRRMNVWAAEITPAKAVKWNPEIVLL